MLKGAKMFDEAPMARFVKRPDYILSPYLDILSYLFHKPWRDVSDDDRVGVMVKLADEQNGTVELDGTVRKELTEQKRPSCGAPLMERRSLSKPTRIAPHLLHAYPSGLSQSR